MSKILIDETTARRVLEALENSVDLVREDAYETEKLYGNYPTRQARVGGLKVLADDHEKAITALREALALDCSNHKPAPVAEPLFKPLIDLHPGLAEELKAMDTAQQEPGRNHWEDGDVFDRIAAIKEQPAPVQQEPVAVMQLYESGWDLVEDVDLDWLHTLPFGTKLYTSPPAQQEPVEYWTVANGWVSDQAEVPAAVWVEPDFWEHCNRVNCGTAYRLPAPGRQPLYTSSPSQRKPLTDEEIETVWRSVQANDFHDCVKPFARAIEAVHGIKGDA